jgi:hypothetical protein
MTLMQNYKWAAKMLHVTGEVRNMWCKSWLVLVAIDADN